MMMIEITREKLLQMVKEGIDLTIEFRDGHGHTEEEAVESAMHDVEEGLDAMQYLQAHDRPMDGIIFKGA